MLEELSVQNYALIDRLVLSFSKGLNIISGETGAGKSILIGAIGLLLGDKADNSVIRQGKETALVSGSIRINQNSQVLDCLNELGIPVEDDCIVLRRTLRRNGRSSAYIGPTAVSRQDLERIASLLFDMHSQHEHQSLFNIAHHRVLLDNFCGLQELSHQYHQIYLKVSSLMQKLDQLALNSQKNQRDIELANFALQEIEKAGLKEGEEEELLAQSEKAKNVEELFSLCDKVVQEMSPEGQASLSSLGRAKNALLQASALDQSLQDLGGRFENVYYELEDLLSSLQGYLSNLDFSAEELDALEDRLALVQKLKNKYGSSYQQIMEYARQCEELVNQDENGDQLKSQWEEELQEARRKLMEKGKELSEKRKAGAVLLEKGIANHLKKLGMPNAEFQVALAVKTKNNESGKTICGPYGLDQIEFLISPNQGEDKRPLNKIASGGEISRVMLALKTMLSHADNINSLIFDEIDSGIGGTVAVSVGEHLKQLSKEKQILCITHLATIAMQADHHIRIEKEVKEERTHTQAYPVKGEERVREISRMLSGDNETESSLQHARGLLEKVQKEAQDE